jgi:SAM-dependent methyltransferase
MSFFLSTRRAVHTADQYANRLEFYSRTITRWIPDVDASVLIVGGGPNDEHVFTSLGYTNVTLTNVGSMVDRCSTPAIAAADAEDLPYHDESFDYAIVHAVLHHCRSPHRALLELYRVARKGAIFFESRDSLSMRLVERLGLVNPYEVSAVEANGGLAGGVRDTAVPNYVYRWSEREVVKTIASYAPHAKHTIRFAHGYGTPCDTNGGPSVRRLLKRVLVATHRLVVTVLPSQRNLLACLICKPELPQDLQRWLIMENDTLRFRQK